jgi:putative MATE family efflux protein
MELVPDPRPVWRQVIYLAWPVLAQQALVFSVGIYDSYLAGNNVPADISKHVAYQAAQGNISYLTWFISSYTVLVSVGSTAMVARFVGARDWQQANRAVQQSVLLSVVLGLAGGGGGWLIAPTVLEWLNLSGDAKQFTVEFLRPLLALLVFQVLEQAGIHCLIGAGDTRTGPIVSGLVALLNIPMAWGLFHGTGPLPPLGFTGIAFGTAFSHVIGSLVVLGVLLRGKNGLRLHWRGLRPDPSLMYRLLRISVPAAVDSLSLVLGQLWFLSLVNQIGTGPTRDYVVAAHGHAIRWEGLGYLSGKAFGVAAMALVGQNLGAHRSEQARRSGWTSVLLGGAFMSLMGCVFFVLAEPMFRLFSPGEHQQPVIQIGVPVLRLVAFAMPALACANILNDALRGAGHTRTPVLITWSGFLGVRIPLAYWLTQGSPNLGLLGAWWAMFADLHVRGALFLWLFARGRWQQTRV